MTSRIAPTGPVGYVVARAQPFSQLATILGNQLHHLVLDKTGLTGNVLFDRNDFVSGIRCS